MCLISFSWQPDAEYPLTLIANRDEFYERPARSVHFWEDNPDILGGRDLQAGGSWLAVNRRGRFAAVTNFRELPIPKDTLSRGNLVRDFLASELSPVDYLSTVDKHAQDFAGFNLLVGNTTGVYYYSNRMNSIITLEPGIYGLCNRLLNTPWPKLLKAKQGLAERLNQDNFAPVTSLMELMRDDSKPPENALPDTGVDVKTEQFLSSCFIASQNYGTRNTSVLQFDRRGKLDWTEQLYRENGKHGQQFSFSVQLSQQ